MRHDRENLWEKLLRLLRPLVQAVTCLVLCCDRWQRSFKTQHFRHKSLESSGHLGALGGVEWRLIYNVFTSPYARDFITPDVSHLSQFVKRNESILRDIPCLPYYILLKLVVLADKSCRRTFVSAQSWETCAIQGLLNYASHKLRLIHLFFLLYKPDFNEQKVSALIGYSFW